MINFAVGPVQSFKEELIIAGENVPYFRTAEFSRIVFDTEDLVKKYADAPFQSKVLFLTMSGTGAMEAAIINLLSEDDKALVVNGGGFGERFVKMLRIHNIPYDEIILKPGTQLKQADLDEYDSGEYSAFLVNMHETSTGVLYDMGMIGEFCRKNGLFLIVDAISSFLADSVSMSDLGIDTLIASSQKALACQPGLSMLVLSERAQNRLKRKHCSSMYFDLDDAMNNAMRGQTPFTPAVGIILQIHSRLLRIEKNGGVEKEILRTHLIADDFRNKIANLHYRITSESLSNAITPLHPTFVSALEVVAALKDQYGIWVCPNGGALKDEIFRVGHLGALTTSDNDALIAALSEIEKSRQ